MRQDQLQRKSEASQVHKKKVAAARIDKAGNTHMHTHTLHAVKVII